MHFLMLCGIVLSMIMRGPTRPNQRLHYVPDYIFQSALSTLLITFPNTTFIRISLLSYGLVLGSARDQQNSSAIAYLLETKQNR